VTFSADERLKPVEFSNFKVLALKPVASGSKKELVNFDGKAGLSLGQGQ
jgi:hypothetical protein